MKKLFLFLAVFTTCLACKQEEAVQPLPVLHFIDFVDASEQNLFKTEKIDTSTFINVYPGGSESWRQSAAFKKLVATNYNEGVLLTHEKATTINKLLNDPFILIQAVDGHLDRDRTYIINGEMHTIQYSSRDGFFKDGQKLKVTTDTIEEYAFYLHHIVLDGY